LRFRFRLEKKGKETRCTAFFTKGKARLTLAPDKEAGRPAIDWSGGSSSPTKGAKRCDYQNKGGGGANPALLQRAKRKNNSSRVQYKAKEQPAPKRKGFSLGVGGRLQRRKILEGNWKQTARFEGGRFLGRGATLAETPFDGEETSLLHMPLGEVWIAI